MPRIHEKRYSGTTAATSDEPMSPRASLVARSATLAEDGPTPAFLLARVWAADDAGVSASGPGAAAGGRRSAASSVAARREGSSVRNPPLEV